MIIIRAPRIDNGYTILRNDILRDDRLSYRARGILAYILSNKDNWRTDAETLARQAKEGRQAIQTAIKELREYGYIIQNKKQNDKGQWITETIVYDAPEEARTAVESLKGNKATATTKTASELVATAWTPIARGVVSQPIGSVTRIVDSAIQNGISAAKIEKALKAIAVSQQTVTHTRLTAAISGASIKARTTNLEADTTNWDNVETLNGTMEL